MERDITKEPVWYLEYSIPQKSFHVDTMERIQSKNLHCILVRKFQPQYVVINGPGTLAEMLEISNNLEKDYSEIFKQFRMEEVLEEMENFTKEI